MRDCAKGVFDGWSLTPEFYALPIHGIRPGTHLNSCQYLRVCLDESLRLSPSIGGLLSRGILPDGLILDGERLPGGVDIGVPHCGKNWEDRLHLLGVECPAKTLLSRHNAGKAMLEQRKIVSKMLTRRMSYPLIPSSRQNVADSTTHGR